MTVETFHFFHNKLVLMYKKNEEMCSLSKLKDDCYISNDLFVNF